MTPARPNAPGSGAPDLPPMMALFYDLGAGLPPSAQTYYGAATWHSPDHARAYAAGMIARLFGVSLIECVL